MALKKKFHAYQKNEEEVIVFDVRRVVNFMELEMIKSFVCYLMIT